MSPDLIIQIVSVILVLILLALMIFTKKAHYVVGGLMLVLIGVFTILFELGVYDLDVNKFPVVKFTIYFMIAFASKDLIKEGVTGKDTPLRYPSIFMGIFLLLLTTLPILNQAGVVRFVIPEYPIIVDAVIYVMCGIVLVLGAFMLVKE